jgi:hypothetical protein
MDENKTDKLLTRIICAVVLLALAVIIVLRVVGVIEQFHIGFIYFVWLMFTLAAILYLKTRF